MKVNPADRRSAKKVRQRGDFLRRPEIQNRCKSRAWTGNLQQTAAIRPQSQKFRTVVQQPGEFGDMFRHTSTQTMLDQEDDRLLSGRVGNHG